MLAQRLTDLVADGEQGVQRCHRVLQDHRDPFAPNVLHFVFGFSDEILALQPHRAADDLGCRRQNAHQRQGQCAFTGTGFAHDAKRFARPQAERDVVDGSHNAGTRR